MSGSLLWRIVFCQFLLVFISSGSASAEDIIDANCQLATNKKISSSKAMEAIFSLPEFIKFRGEIKKKAPSHKLVIDDGALVSLSMHGKELGCFWMMSAYEDASDHRDTWNTFFVDMSGKVRFVQDTEGGWIPLKQWRSAK